MLAAEDGAETQRRASEREKNMKSPLRVFVVEHAHGVGARDGRRCCDPSVWSLPARVG
jgi:hypothetical protein